MNTEDATPLPDEFLAGLEDARRQSERELDEVLGFTPEPPVVPRRTHQALDQMLRELEMCNRILSKWAEMPPMSPLTSGQGTVVAVALGDILHLVLKVVRTLTGEDSPRVRVGDGSFLRDIVLGDEERWAIVCLLDLPLEDFYRIVVSVVEEE